MAASIELLGVDMNNPTNLGFYTQILLFNSNLDRSTLIFPDRSKADQRAIQGIAHSMNLEYEYSVSTRLIRISRAAPSELPMISELEEKGIENQLSPSFSFEDQLLSEENFELPAYTQDDDLDFFGGDLTSELSAMGSTDSSSDYFTTTTQPMSNHEQDMNWYISDPSTPTAENWGQILSPVSPQRESTLRNGFPGDSRKSNGRSGLGKKAIGSLVATMKISSPQKSSPRACVSCRRRKVRCSSEEPICQTCRLDSLVCTYLPPPKKSRSRHQQPSGSVDLQAERGTILPINPYSETESTIPSSSQAEDLLSPTACFHPMSEVQDQVPHSRKPSMSMPAGTTSRKNAEYQEIVFDSNSIYSSIYSSSGSRPASIYSNDSGKSGRRGPLNDYARAGMVAVKTMGACWRCKFLRKTCDTQSPCGLCPKGDQSKWEAVGCNRGHFKSPMSTIHFCPASLRTTTEPDLNDNHKDQEAALLTQKNEQERSAWINADSDSTYRDQSNRLRTDLRLLLLKNLGSASAMVNQQLDPGIITPLRDGALCVIWEFANMPSSMSQLGEVMGKLTRLLASAIVFQARLSNDQLIPQSLICLRSCLEALFLQAQGCLVHKRCPPRPPNTPLDDETTRKCSTGCIMTLQMHLDIYIRELSKVFFKKENLKKKKLWWLSAFFSFCIQAVVRKVLLQLEHPIPNSQNGLKTSGASEYLYKPLRLFIASSGTFDPLWIDNKRPQMLNTAASGSIDLEGGEPSAQDYALARWGVQQESWELKGIRSSGDYLKSLFEDGADGVGEEDGSDMDSDLELPDILE